MNILISGICGFMGKEVLKLCLEGYRGARAAFGVDISADGSSDNVFTSFADVPYDAAIDCIVDFSHHSAVKSLLAFAVERGIPTVVATTGHTEEEYHLLLLYLLFLCNNDVLLLLFALYLLL